MTDLPKPLFRIICHCKTCQQFLSSHYNDECTFKLSEIPNVDTSDIVFHRQKKTFSIIQRGTCKHCGKPSIYKAKFGPFIELLMIPTAYLDKELIPKPDAQIYCKSQQVELETDSKRANGHFASQLTLIWQVMKVLFRK